jgi:dienelactone hydrolase
VAEVLLFHHAQGLTPGCLSFADRLRAAGHVVHAPDLYDGNTFDDLDDGVGYAKQVGFDTILERGRRAADGLPEGIVYAGFSLGAMPGQMLAQTRPGAKGALLFHGCIPPSEFGGPQGVPLQIHLMEADEWALEGDLDVARELDETVESAELFLYPAIDTCSLTTACPTTTKKPQRWSRNGRSSSSTTSSSRTPQGRLA